MIWDRRCCGPVAGRPLCFCDLRVARVTCRRTCAAGTFPVGDTVFCTALAVMRLLARNAQESKQDGPLIENLCASSSGSGRESLTEHQIP